MSTIPRDGQWPPLPSADQKGVGFRSLNPEWQRWVPQGIQCSNATNPREAGGSPGESSLFFVKGRAPWNKILRNKSTREAKDLYIENYKTLMKKSKRTQIDGEIYYVHGSEET